MQILKIFLLIWKILRDDITWHMHFLPICVCVCVCVCIHTYIVKATHLEIIAADECSTLLILTAEYYLITLFIHFLRFIFWDELARKNAVARNLLSKFQNQKTKAICNCVHDTKALAGFGIRFRRSSVSLCDLLFKFLSAELYQSGFLEHPQRPGKPTCSVLSLTFFKMFLSVRLCILLGYQAYLLGILLFWWAFTIPLALLQFIS